MTKEEEVSAGLPAEEGITASVARELAALERWAGEQGPDDAFAGQVRQWAMSKRDDLSGLPAETMEAAQRWLEELRVEAAMLRQIDYRTAEYERAVARVLALARPEYAANALVLLSRQKELERERADFGPYFARDMARVVGLPDDAWMDAIAVRIKEAVAAEARVAELERAAANVGHWGHSWECQTGGGCVCGLTDFRAVLFGLPAEPMLTAASVERELLTLEAWAEEQGPGDDFAVQVRQWAMTKRDVLSLLRKSGLPAAQPPPDIWSAWVMGEAKAEEDES